MLLWTAVGKVDDMDGTPTPDVIKTPLFPVANPEMVFVADENRS